MSCLIKPGKDKPADKPQRQALSRLPEIGFCAEKARLMNEFVAAIHEIGELQAQQARALIDGDPDFARFDVLIHMATDKKDQVKYAWLTHLEHHHC